VPTSLLGERHGSSVLLLDHAVATSTDRDRGQAEPPGLEVRHQEHSDFTPSSEGSHPHEHQVVGAHGQEHQGRYTVYEVGLGSRRLVAISC
jgi:hypothetical protein